MYDPKIHGRNAELKESYGLRKDFGYKFLANYYSVMFGDDTPYIDHKVAELRDLFKDEL